VEPPTTQAAPADLEGGHEMGFDLKELGHDLATKLELSMLQHLKDNPEKLQRIAVFIIDHLMAAIETKPEGKV
jgi:hypothetical protein